MDRPTPNPRVVVRKAGSGRPPLGPYLREVWARRSLVNELSRAEVEAGHADTILGRAWSLLNPVLLATVYWFLVRIVRGGHLPEGVTFVSIIGGLFTFVFARNAVNQAKTSILRGSRLVLNTAFPRLVLPLTSTLTALRLFLPAIGLYAVLHVAAGRPVGRWLVVSLFLVALLVVMNAGLAAFVSIWTVAIRDLGEFVQYGLMVALYATPVLYPVESLSRVGLRVILYLNPFGGVVGALQQTLAGHAPSASLVLAAVAWTVAWVGLGLWSFLSREGDLAHWL